MAQTAQPDFAQQIDALLLDVKTKRVTVQRIFFLRSEQYVIGVQAQIKENTEL